MQCWSVVLGAFLLITFNGVAAAQAIPEAARFKPKACAASDSVLGAGGEFGKTRIISPASMGGKGTILITETMRPESKAAGIAGMNMMLMYEKPAAVDPRINLQFNVVDSVLRAGAATRLTMVLDDSVHWNLGPTQVTPWRNAKPGKVPQGLATILSPQETRRLVQAQRIQATLGSTDFAFTAPQLAAVQGIYVAAMCGQPR